MEFTREEVNELLQKSFEGDQEAFEAFYDQYNGVVTHHAKMFFGSFQKACGILYDFEDVTQELWCALYDRLKISYDYTKANIVTFMYTILPHEAMRILNYENRAKRQLNNNHLSLDTPINKSDRDSDTTMLDFIMDPSESLDYHIIEETTIYETIYMLSKAVSKLTDTQRLVYLHSIKGLSQTESSIVLGVSRQCVSQAQIKNKSKIVAFVNRTDKIDYKEADRFALLLLSNKSDDEISKDINCDLTTIKICRGILAQIVS